MVQSGHKSHAADALQFIKPPHVLIVEARFYAHINDLLVEGAEEVLAKAGVTFEKVVVPGALEIPAAVSLASQRTTGRPFDAFVALGCVIRGATSHYETVCFESARGLSDLALAGNLAVGNGILTVENEEQALERADKARMNKGGGAAEAALVMLHLKQVFGLWPL
jgi:6,7-dimethyl-8-ribityllumazine synthase